MAIERFGVQQYFLYRAFPDIVTHGYNAQRAQLRAGRAPGEQHGVVRIRRRRAAGAAAYGYNRADWSYIPGGVVSGTALIRPDFPELKDFPWLWQQPEYVMGGGTTDFTFLVLAADQVLREQASTLKAAPPPADRARRSVGRSPASRSGPAPSRA